MSIAITQIFFTVLNVGLYVVIAAWYLKNTLIPSIRTAVRNQDDTLKQITEEVEQRSHNLAQAQSLSAQEEREVARLTVCMEQWSGILQQRVAAVEHETRMITMRYKDRCEENARLRVVLDAQRTITKQALKNAYAILKQKYADNAKQVVYVESVIDNAIRKEYR